MSDPISAAKAARESLARALGAIQSDPGGPPGLMNVAEPISNAMGALFQIERSGGAASSQNAPAALAAVRQALAMLQQQPSQHSGVRIASESVAGALGLIHELTHPAPVHPAPPIAQPAAPPQAPQAPRPYAPPAPAPQARGPQAYAATQVASRPEAIAPVVDGRPVAQPARAPAPVPAGSGPRVEAELGAHSPSNFYKGLSGNDVVEHGGLFVSTYQIPPIGQTVVLHVSLPGGYEFEALAVVRWTRDTVESGQGAPPGFGAQFVDIAPEARQLVYRYVRNREPLFHDDI
jgi:hypothetical protein